MNKNWTESEVNFLIEHYPNNGIKYCVKELNRSYNSISRKAQKLQIKVSEEICSILKKEGIKKSNNPRKKHRVGEIYTTYQGYKIEIIEYFDARNCTIIFNDENNTIKYNVAVKEIKLGCVKNYNHPEVLSKGYIGVGKYTARVDGKMSKCYTTWFNMLSRCYQSTNNRNSSYCDVTVCEDWLNFQNFAEWFYTNFKNNGWFLDKDILCPTCKSYSPETCIFVPNEVNVLFSKNNISTYDLPRGVYPKDGKYESAISKFGKQHYLGIYDTIEEAHCIYINAKKNYLLEVSIKWRGVLDDSICNAIKDFDINLL